MRLFFAFRVAALLLAAFAAFATTLPAIAAPAQLPLDKRLAVRLIRATFEAGGARTRRALEKHEPAVEVTTVEALPYREDDPVALLDIHFPASAAEDGKKLPVVIWIHGGAWLSGSRQDALPYFRLIAAEGYAVVAPDYSLAPSATFPHALRQLSDVRVWLEENADEYPIDPGRLFLAGDSAGAQLAAQLAAMGSNPGHAEDVGIPGVFTPDVVRGVILQCGLFDVQALVRENPDRSRLMHWGTSATVLAYAGTTDPDSPVLGQISPIPHLTRRFPAAWITGGNDDPLTPGHSVVFAETLRELGVPVTALFWPDDHQPKLPHLYPFNLDNNEGWAAFDSMVKFLRSRD